MEDFLVIGQIVKPQGIKGELKVKSLTDSTSRFKGLKEVFIEEKKYKVLSAKIAPDFVILSLNSIFDRNIAETFRFKYISVERDNAVELEENNFFIVDILGCEILDDENNSYGKVIDVTQAKTDVFTVENCNGKIMRFPFLKDALVKVDIKNKRIIFNKKRLMEISCYENWYFNPISRNVYAT